MRSNVIVNPLAYPISLNDLVFDGEINSEDRIIIPNGSTSNMYYAIHDVNNGMGWYVTSQKVFGRRRITWYDTNVHVGPGMAFWYDRRGTTPMTIRFK